MISDVEMYTRISAIETRMSTLGQLILRLYNVIMDLVTHIRRHSHQVIA